MQLTKGQRRNLELYANYHSAPPTLWQLVRQNLWRYGAIALLVILLFFLVPAAGAEYLKWIATGLFLGVLLRDISRFRQFVHTWPAMEAVLDWQRLEALLNKPDGAEID
jgi:hypothetical protein